MKIIHHIAIKYLTYLVLNKRKLNNNKNQYSPYIHYVCVCVCVMYYCLILFHIYIIKKHKEEPTHRKVSSKPHHASRGFLNMVRPMGLNSRRIAQSWFFFTFIQYPHRETNEIKHISNEEVWMENRIQLCQVGWFVACSKLQWVIDTNTQP